MHLPKFHEEAVKIESFHIIIFCRNRQLVSMTKYLCFSLVPLAAFVSLVIHFLVKYDHIQIDESDDKSIDEPKPVKLPQNLLVVENIDVTKDRRRSTVGTIIVPNFIN